MKKCTILFSSVFLLTSLIGCNSVGLYSKEVILFKDNSKNKTKMKLYFTDKDKGVPYINLNDGVNLIKETTDIKYEKNFDIKGEVNNNIFTLKRENGASISFDSSLNVIRSEDILKFKVAPHAVNPLDITSFDPFWYDESGKVIKNQIKLTSPTLSSGGFYYIKGDETFIDLSLYDINIYKINNNFYCPFTTFYNVIGNGSASCSFNGENLFYTDGRLDNTIKDENDKTLKDYFYSFKSLTRPSDLIKYNYNELCRSMDCSYGLKKEHGIENGFDDFFTKTGVKELLYKDTFEYGDEKKAFGPNFALDRLSYYYLGDIHTSSAFSSPYGFGEENAYDFNTYGQRAISGNEPIAYSYYNFLTDMSTRARFRRDQGLIEPKSSSYIIKDPIKYSDDKETLIITFDQFVMEKDVDFYYSDEFKNNKKKYLQDEETRRIDIVALTSIANDEIKNNNNIKKVIIDLSSNRGGVFDAAIFFLSWLESGKILFKDPISGAKGMNSYLSDINLDKKFNVADDVIFYKKEGDKIVKRDLDVYCLISPQSFSCGNYVPNMLKQTGKAKLVGSKSGGGACAILVGATADGSGFNFSSNYHLCGEFNGSFYSIDKGVEPDYYVDKLETMYGGTNGNRENIIDFIDSIK